jgi:hypothetical protein
MLAVSMRRFAMRDIRRWQSQHNDQDRANPLAIALSSQQGYAGSEHRIC